LEDIQEEKATLPTIGEIESRESATLSNPIIIEKIYI